MSVFSRVVDKGTGVVIFVRPFGRFLIL